MTICSNTDHSDKMGRRYSKYNETNICDICKVEKLVPGNACREYDEKGNMTGRWLCKACNSNRWRYGTADKNKIKSTKSEYYKKRLESMYNDTNICDICKVEKLVPGKTCREYDEKGNRTGRWLCKKCWWNTDYKKRLDSIACIRRQLTDRRLYNQDPYSPNAKGDNFQELTCRWRSIVSTILVEDLNKKLDCYNTPIDHSPDSELGILQTRGRLYDTYNQRWGFTRLGNEHSKKFDNMIC